MAKTTTKTATKTTKSNAKAPRADKRGDKFAEQYKAFGIDPGKCLDGCGGSPRKGLFLPGHDARLKSALQKASREGKAAERGKASKQASLLGWEKFLAAPEAAVAS